MGRKAQSAKKTFTCPDRVNAYSQDCTRSKGKSLGEAVKRERAVVGRRESEKNRWGGHAKMKMFGPIAEMGARLRIMYLPRVRNETRELRLEKTRRKCVEREQYRGGRHYQNPCGIQASTCGHQDRRGGCRKKEKAGRYSISIKRRTCSTRYHEVHVNSLRRAPRPGVS